MTDEDYMNIALNEAKKAKKHDEVPIGAIIVKNGKIIAKAHNKTEKMQDGTAHAEMLAIKKACKKIKSWRLEDCTIYITVEPCPMCAGAIVNSRIKKVIFGAYEKKSGCAVSKYPILENNGLNHKTSFVGGIREKECSEIIKNYFKLKRSK
ncbi:MAG: tRNA adenosine(34) deaminase TadA [Clostridia bacterium]|nr:tRNA adenosine(34) deaminase TadA [Clostridia bacterium]